MDLPIDCYPTILRDAAEAYLADGLEAGRLLLAPIAEEIWPGLPRRAMPLRRSVAPAATTIAGRRTFSEARSAATYYRDQFRCRYCGCEIIPKSIVVLMHSLYPRELPFHEHYKRGCMHPVFWTRVAEADHLVAGSIGGAWTDPENHVTACVACNTRKGDMAIDELGWQLKDPRPGWDGLVPLYQHVWERAGRPRSSYHSRWLRAFDAAHARQNAPNKPLQPTRAAEPNGKREPAGSGPRG